MKHEENPLDKSQEIAIIKVQQKKPMNENQSDKTPEENKQSPMNNLIANYGEYVRSMKKKISNEEAIKQINQILFDNTPVELGALFLAVSTKIVDRKEEVIKILSRIN